MKIENVKVGLLVEVKDSLSEYYGQIGKIKQTNQGFVTVKFRGESESVFNVKSLKKFSIEEYRAISIH